MRRQLLVLVTIASLGCAGASAEARLKTYFDLPEDTTSDTLAFRDAILRRMPRGTPDLTVDSLLAGRGVGKDGLSSYHRATDGDTAVVRVEYDRRGFRLVATSYAVRLAFDSSGRLDDVHVVRWLTGP